MLGSILFRRVEHCPLTAAEEAMLEGRRLSHVIVEVNTGLEDLRDMFEQWTKMPPCLNDSFPTSSHYSKVTLTLLFTDSALLTVEALQRAGELFGKLPQFVQNCFASFEIRHSTMTKASFTPEALFSKLLNNELGLANPKYVFYMGTHCVPLQKDWLNQFDFSTRPLHDEFWMLGSIYRGPPKNLGNLTANRLHITSNALYNLADPAFAAFYSKEVGPYIEKNPISPFHERVRWETGIFAYLEDVGLKPFLRHLPNFHLSNLIWDSGSDPINPTEVLKGEPQALVACGSIIKK